ncbi:MAG: hypothetical protein CSA72_04565 [Rhodobacterales bacterium]|nr:MAG: hypothetical protein CSA72_04565 [Rhodobacterales bacterium]
MSDQNPFDAMMQMGQDWARALNPALGSFMPQVEKLWPTMPKEWMETVMGKTFNPEGLDAKTRMLLTLAGMTMQGVPAEPAFRAAVRHAREAGATKQEIAEAIGQMGLFAGVPAMSRALQMAQTALSEDDEGEPRT